MKRALRTSIFVPALLMAVSATNLHAENPTSKLAACADQLKGCLILSGQQKSDCLFKFSSNETCKNSSWGKIADKRWQFEPGFGNDMESAPALLGPQLVNKECLQNFDNQLSAELIRGEPARSTLSRLDKQLDNCAASSVDELLRP
ncbi:MAG: hypothetical protein DCC75_02050 [Proteobacteria bacterium]|nr:MAG: hypothetical protein DCC75_02050 [Pseudomonadota bacterium]